MDRFIWGNDYKIGVPEMDCEHLILFSIYNQLVSVIESEREHEAIDDIANALVSYIRTHFLHEERMMEKAKYPDLAGHKVQHREIIQELDTLYDAYRKTGDTKLIRDLRSFLFSWLSGHILKTDRAYVPFVLKAG